MSRTLVQSLYTLVLIISLAGGSAAAPVLGVITAKGGFQIDNSLLSGSATLFEGNRVETHNASSQLHLNNGARMRLAGDSRGLVYRDRLVLEKGSGQIFNAGNYRIEAQSLRIEGGVSTNARVSLAADRSVEVLAVQGPVNVYKKDGMLIARLEAGNGLSFAPEPSGASAPSKMTGCLQLEQSRYFLTDEVSNVRFHLTGQGLSDNVSKRIEITGTVQAGNTSPADVRVHSVKVLASKCSSGAAAKAAGVGAAAGGAAAGKAAGAAIGMTIASKAVIAGVVVAGAAAGVAVATIADDEPAISPTTP